VAKVTMPQLGESVAEGTIGKWLKQPGDHVAKYEPLLEVITDKVNAEVPSPFEGVLKEILAEEGATVPNNAEIAVIETADEPSAGNGSAGPADNPTADNPTADDPTAEKPTAEKPTAEGPPTERPSEAAPTENTSAPAAVPPDEATGPAGSDERPAAAPASAPAPSATSGHSVPATAVAAAAAGKDDARMTPAVRRLLREHGLAATMIVGTGGGGRITREDVLNYVEAQRTGQTVGGQAVAVETAAKPASAPPQAAPASTQPVATAAPAAPAATAPVVPPGQDEQLVAWTQMRKGVANAMVRSKTTVPHAYTTVEVDVTGLVRLRDASKGEYQAREGIGLSYVPFLVKAVCEGLRKHPLLNALWTEEGLLVKRQVNVGIAVAVDDGLIVPVVHDADQLSIAGLNRAIQDVAGRARANRLRLDDLQGGTITVNNTGWFGSVASQSIVNTPQVVIVNMEAIVKRPVVRETPEGDTIAIRSIMNLPAAFDHRATDGAQVGRFVADVKSWLEAIGPETPIY
jgi:pyruvate/2-oxoglutarate dehydrogenase complex dihydrolipoamide acyltransferase (E2) component